MVVKRIRESLPKWPETFRFSGFIKHKLPTFITLWMPMAGPKLHGGGGMFEVVVWCGRGVSGLNFEIEN